MGEAWLLIQLSKVKDLSLDEEPGFHATPPPSQGTVARQRAKVCLPCSPATTTTKGR